MAGLLGRLAAGERLVSDGAMGTQLMEAGLGPGECPEAWVLDRPEVVRNVARLYLESGADLVHTDTFGGSPAKLAAFDLDGRAEDINRRAVELVRQAVADGAYVSGSMGPSGRILEPYGDASEGELYEGFERQAGALARAGVDVFCVETMTDLREALLAVRAARAAAPGTPVMATMTFDATPVGFRTIMGVGVADAVRGLVEAGADVLGSNCGNGIERMIEVARVFRAATPRPLLIQPNAGLPELKDGTLVYAESAEYFADRVPDLLQAGASIVGGCCGTTPGHIRAVRAAVDRR